MHADNSGYFFVDFAAGGTSLASLRLDAEADASLQGTLHTAAAGGGGRGPTVAPLADYSVAQLGFSGHNYVTALGAHHRLGPELALQARVSSIVAVEPDGNGMQASRGMGFGLRSKWQPLSWLTATAGLAWAEMQSGRQALQTAFRDRSGGKLGLSLRLSKRLQLNASVVTASAMAHNAYSANLHWTID